MKADVLTYIILWKSPAQDRSNLERIVTLKKDKHMPMPNIRVEGIRSLKST